MRTRVTPFQVGYTDRKYFVIKNNEILLSLDEYAYGRLGGGGTARFSGLTLQTDLAYAMIAVVHSHACLISHQSCWSQ